MLITASVYAPGLSGGYLFDDYPNIVDNHGVQPHDASLSSLVGAALSSPSSEFKRPLASLSFAVNYLATGLDPYWMKLTNLAIHLLNGLLVFLLARALLLTATFVPPELSSVGAHPVRECSSRTFRQEHSRTGFAPTGMNRHAGIVAALIAAGWLLLPINLTGVLYVVQRMESMANLFVLAGLIGYVAGRRRMLGLTPLSARKGGLAWGRFSAANGGFVLCLVSVTVPAALGILAKETAVMLPLYALLIEWAVFRFKSVPRCEVPEKDSPKFDSRASRLKPLPQDAHRERHDRRVVALFLVVLVLPMVLGLAWLLPGILQPETWATRDFTLGTRLLSEARIVVDYIVWTLLPTPHALSFYHDNFHISTGLLAPWTTLASIVLLAVLVALMLWLRPRRPLAALGIALFLGCQLLTGTILPLELIYEHRNYFASFGLLLAVVPLLAAPSCRSAPCARSSEAGYPETDADKSIAHRVRSYGDGGGESCDALPFALPRHVLLAGLLLSWTALTALTAYAWGNPLRLAADLAARAPQSPRAEYELGRTYIVYSHYDPSSPFTRLAYAPLEKAATLPDASILPEQALIFMNARMHLPIKDAWWDSLIGKLTARKSTVQDESSLAALTQCVREHRCDLPKARMMEAFMAALSHPDPDARLLAMYGDYAWNVLEDHQLGLRMTREAVKVSPDEPAYQITLIRMLAAEGRTVEAEQALKQLATLNIGGRINSSLAELHKLPGIW
ncbi:MAG: tetratricopeptide repeat protein [Rhodanobacter sp.]